jgi:hypothetical protein
MLASAPAGLSWQVVPTLTASGPEQEAQLSAVCWNATSIVDTYCRQPLRAVVNTETELGPGRGRITVDRDTGLVSLITRRWPVTDVAAIQTSPARAFPATWTPVPAGQFRIRRPVIDQLGPTPPSAPSGGNVIDVAPGCIPGHLGRGSLNVQWSYTSGWPHTSLTAAAGEAAETLDVDDVTGWGTGWAAWIYDGPNTEVAQVTAGTATVPMQLPNGAGTVQAGPGTLTLAAPLVNEHSDDAVISAVPSDAIHAAYLAAAVQALETIDAIATQSLSGQMAGGTGALATQYEYLLDPFLRVA